MIIAHSTKSNARGNQCIIEETSAKINLEAECYIMNLFCRESGCIAFAWNTRLANGRINYPKSQESVYSIKSFYIETKTHSNYVC